MSTQALGSAVSGLRVAQKALDVTATNISSANVEGYTRKTLHQEALYADNVGVGVRYGEIQRYVDKAVQRDYRTQLSVENFYSVRESYLSRIMAFHGSTDQETNIAARMSDLHDSFVLLSAEPDSTSRQATLVSHASRLAKTFNDFSQQLVDMRNEVNKQIKSEVDEINGALQDIAELNRKIAGLSHVGQSTAGLEDLRDNAIKVVAQKMDISYYTDGDNMVVLQTRQGHVLADVDARPITFNQTTLTIDALYPDSASGIVIQNKDGSGYDIASGDAGGSLGALLSLRDRDIPAYTAQVDELAHKMMMRFDAQGLRLFTDNTGGVPINDPAVYAGIAARIQVNPYVLADNRLLQQGTSGGPLLNSGDASVIMRVVEFTFGRTMDASGTPNIAFNNDLLGANRRISINVIGDSNAGLMDFARGMMDAQAGDYNVTKATLTSESQYRAEVETRLLDGSAVNTDEEMTRMIEIQRAYSASAKMITALDELFRDLLNAIQ